jgi:hypothetical protein
MSDFGNRLAMYEFIETPAQRAAALIRSLVPFGTKKEILS